jgi:hypothetical protein
MRVKNTANCAFLLQLLMHFTFLSLLLVSCKKSNGPNPQGSDFTPKSGLVKTIALKLLKPDSSGSFYTAVDSFLYDKQSRIVTVISYDDNLTASRYVRAFTYIGDDLLPFSYVDSTTPLERFVVSGSMNRVLADSLPAVGTQTRGDEKHFSYYDGLIIERAFTPCAIDQPGCSGFTFLDSLFLDADTNIVSLIHGGFRPDWPGAMGTFIYGRYSAYKYSYSKIDNPIYHYNPVATMLFFPYRKDLWSKNLPSEIESITYVDNGIITDTVTIVNEVDPKGIIQRSVYSPTGETISWTYY